ncbi:50S ribosomal protein L32 [Candidatus Roizmanbacteria bacterium CG_4_9_14_0_8_um_filter_34_12]|uniref:Large ribosomal subunit protein bL32 n=4 Tax=Candidatus Roizmaniibacteriota TaxID=1752723 RepID=A0A2M7E570_9BACT|nr:50S ribosomal protein L32 [Candidatus Roizmanbacteria bacterium]PIV62877.1 MAG: 50S ribosomal protein L32 [Candidatus Roizmanbacteria bacterium CG01_land_8_20_14_3_00_33_9]PIX70939.1 MAG: 50S ribosomal protein L32 [Candidatus Roizmanbacteria bacterium CG_4_10_14_3_um_filter_33_21]PJB89341.1 MAG: 50S ribosomal protein L32 [Candidatus Roizmanbacteria bacterium CG_4_9_14_0_8_um_filter_34_12]
MAPLPKRKHSNARKGRRMQDRQKLQPQLVVCKHCMKKKLPHQICKACKK